MAMAYAEVSNMFNSFHLNPFYAPESDIGASVNTEVNADLGTDTGAETEVDPFASLSFSIDSEEPEEESAETEEETTKEEVVETKEEPKVDEKRTSKQDPKFDAVAAELRREKQKAAQLEKEINEHKEWQRKQFGHDDLTKYREEIEKQTQEQFQTKLNEQWNKQLDLAKQMRDAGYDEQVVTGWLDAQKESLEAKREKNDLQKQFNEFKSQLEKSQKDHERLQREKSINEGKQILLDQHKSLKGKYGDLVPEANNFEELIQNLDPKIVGLISTNGLTMEDAFKLVNYEKIAQQEKSLVEKRTTANIVDRSKKTVETNKTEKKPEETLTPGQIKFAKEFGVDPKEVAKRSNPNLFKKSKGVS